MKRFLQTIAFVFLVFACLSISRSVWNSYEKLQSLSTSKEEIASLEKENQLLKEEIEYRKTPFYLEKSAREKLGLGRSSETVYLVENKATGSATVDETASLPTWQKWLKLFF